MICFLTCSCSIIQLNLDEKYQPLGTAVLTANDLLLAKYPKERPQYVSQEEYKNLLKENYLPLYDRLYVYPVKIKTVNNNFVVSIYDGDKLILTDWLCTEGYIDCWSYNNECNLNTIKIECEK